MNLDVIRKVRIMNKVKAECGSCGATGLYRGFAEPRGVAVVCLNCGGTGCHEIKYTPFTQRKPKMGVGTVQLSRGPTILSCGPGGKSCTYAQFQAGIMPPV